MNKNCFFLITMMTSASLVAQTNTNPPPATPPSTAETAAPSPASAEQTNAPAAKAEKKKSSKKKSSAKRNEAATELKTVPLVPGPAVVVANHVNVRGQSKLNSEVLTHLTNGQPVTVIEEITHNNSATNEPSAWAKILLPAGAHVWVNSSYIDVTNKAVVPNKLKLRGGPGENYSVLGIIKRGDVVKEVATKGDWMEIEPPPEAYSFVAAQYLKQEPPGQVAAAPPEPAPAPTTVAEAPTLAPAPTNAPPAPVPAPTLPTAEAAPSTGSTNAPAEPVVEEPPPKRIVQREGIVRGTISVQAPTKFELVSPDNGRAIDYLYTPSHQLDLRRYKGLRIIVTGEESLDERWKNTPVITIQRIQVLE